MLSGCEMVKRAAAAKLKTLLEHHEGDSAPSSGGDNGSEAVIGKLIESAYNGAKLQLSGKTLSEVDIKSSDTNEEIALGKITGFVNNLTANVLDSISGDDVNPGGDQMTAKVDVVDDSAVEQSGAVISIAMENDVITVASCEIDGLQSECTDGEHVHSKPNACETKDMILETSSAYYFTI